MPRAKTATRTPPKTAAEMIRTVLTGLAASKDRAVREWAAPLLRENRKRRAAR